MMNQETIDLISAKTLELWKTYPAKGMRPDEIVGWLMGDTKNNAYPYINDILEALEKSGSPHSVTPTNGQIAVIVAVTLYGPRHVGPPPAAVINKIFKTFKGVGNDVPRDVERVLVHGLILPKSSINHPAGWRTFWHEYAFKAIRSMLRNILQSDKWLGCINNLVWHLEGEAKREHLKDVAQSVGDLLACKLLEEQRELNLWKKKPSIDLSIFLLKKIMGNDPKTHPNGFTSSPVFKLIYGPNGEPLVKGQVLVCRYDGCTSEISPDTDTCLDDDHRWTDPRPSDLDPNQNLPEKLWNQLIYRFWSGPERIQYKAWRCLYCGGIFFLSGRSKENLGNCPTCKKDDRWAKRRLTPYVRANLVNEGEDFSLDDFDDSYSSLGGFKDTQKFLALIKKFLKGKDQVLKGMLITRLECESWDEVANSADITLDSKMVDKLKVMLRDILEQMNKELAEIQAIDQTKKQLVDEIAFYQTEKFLGEAVAFIENLFKEISVKRSSP